MNAAELIVWAQLLGLGLRLRTEDIKTIAQNPQILNYASARRTATMSSPRRYRARLKLEVSRVARLYRLVDGCAALWLKHKLGADRLSYWDRMDEVIRQVIVDRFAKHHSPPQYQRDLIDDLVWLLEWCGSQGRDPSTIGWKSALRAQLRSVPISPSVIARRCALLVSVGQISRDLSQDCVRPFQTPSGEGNRHSARATKLWGRICRSSLDRYLAWHTGRGDVLGFSTQKLRDFEVHLRSSGMQVREVEQEGRRVREIWRWTTRFRRLLRVQSPSGVGVSQLPADMQSFLDKHPTR